MLSQKNHCSGTVVFILLVAFVFQIELGHSALALESMEPITLVAQEVHNEPVLPSLYPTDVTNVGIGRQQELFRPGPVFYALQKLPSRLWFNLSAETSQRYESNVFFTAKRRRSDYIYRILPNISIGYNIFKQTSVYCNYFVLKDVFTVHNSLTFPTTQSLSLGLRHEYSLGARNSLQLDFQARELWQATRLHQADFLPGVTFTRVLTPATIAFTNVILQMRGRNYFVAPTREIDPFYTLGVLHSRGNWVFTTVGTLVTNFRHPPFNDAIPRTSNNAFIVDFEVSHPVSKKLPGLVAFVRAEPIWNYDSRHVPGISGYDFRLFGGFRYSLVKPAYNSSVDKLRQQLIDTSNLPGNRGVPLPPINPAIPNAPPSVSSPSQQSESTPAPALPSPPPTEE